MNVLLCHYSNIRKGVIKMTTQSFLSEYIFTEETLPNLLEALESQSVNNAQQFEALPIDVVKDPEKIASLLESYAE